MTDAHKTLFSPIKLGPIALRNRNAMAPLTRQMAHPDGTPTDEMAAYYARRARGGLGLIITEGTYEQEGQQFIRAVAGHDPAFRDAIKICRRPAQFRSGRV